MTQPSDGDGLNDDQPQPDWHTYGTFDVKTQARFILSEVRTPEEMVVALAWMKLRGLEPQGLPDSVIPVDLHCGPPHPNPRTVRETEDWYADEKRQIRAAFFAQTDEERKQAYLLQNDRFTQERGVHRIIQVLGGVNQAVAETYGQIFTALRRGGSPVENFLRAHRLLVHVMRQASGNPRLDVLNDQQVMAAFPDLPPWTRSHISCVAVHADDAEGLQDEIERCVMLYLFLMVRATWVLMRPRMQGTA